MPIHPYQDLTIGDIADRAHDGWLWAYCPIPCGRAVAIPLEYFIAKLGRQTAAETILATLRCTSCGGHPTTFSVPSYAGTPGDPMRQAPIPWDRVPGPIRSALGQAAQEATSEPAAPAGGRSAP